jgi:hypothetical protein
VTQAGPYGFKDTPPAQGAASGIRGKQAMTVFALEVFGASVLKEETRFLFNIIDDSPVSWQFRS